MREISNANERFNSFTCYIMLVIWILLSEISYLHT